MDQPSLPGGREPVSPWKDFGRVERVLGGVVAAMIVLAIGAIFFVGLRTQSVLLNAESLWQSEQSVAQERLWDLIRLERMLGYGGAFSDINNAIRSGQVDPAIQAEERINAALEILERYREWRDTNIAGLGEIASNGAPDKLDVLRASLTRYRVGLADLRDALEEGQREPTSLQILLPSEARTIRFTLDALTYEWRQHLEQVHLDLATDMTGAARQTGIVLLILPVFAGVALMWGLYRRRLQQAVAGMEASERRFRELFEGGSMGVMVLDPAHKPVLVNQTLRALVNWPDTDGPDLPDSEPNAEDGPFAQIFTDQAKQSFSEELGRVFAGEVDHSSLRLEVIAQDYSSLWMDTVIRPISWGKERYVQVAMTNVTELVERESELEYHRSEMDRQGANLVELAESLHEEHSAAEAARLETEERRRFLQTLLETIPNPIYYKDLDGRLLMCNTAFAQFHGFAEPSLMVGQTSRDYVNEAYDRETQEMDGALIVEGGSKQYERTLALKDGSEHTALISKAVYETTTGQPTGVVGVITDISEQKRLEDELRRLATTDPLTSCLNRRAFVERAQNEINRAKRYGEPMSMLLFDIDHFKKVNDSYGHAVGDVALKLFAEHVHDSLRVTDLFGRLGGEEFAALLPQTPRTQGVLLANRIRTRISAVEIPTDNGPITVTVSIGASGFGENGDTVDGLLKAADGALYVAKEKGRNRVVEAA
ncbi:MAG: diguanylate cyclase [Rhodospirillaceae bacterium]